MGLLQTVDVLLRFTSHVCGIYSMSARHSYRVLQQCEFKALHNFQCVLNPLKQDPLLLFCNEGVFYIATGIILQRPEEFKYIVLMIGNFYLAKAV